MSAGADSDGYVLLVDRDQLFSAALATLLGEEGMLVEPPCTTLAAALRDVSDGPAPRLIVLDPTTLEAEDAVAQLRQAAPDSGIVVLTGDMTDSALVASLSAGADAHLSKTASFEALNRSMQLVLLGQSVFPPRAMELWNGRPGASPAPAQGGLDADLSPREAQILSCVLAGHSNKNIARRLSITESTVKMHFKNVMRKIQAQNRTQAAVWAMEHGITPMT